MKKILVPTDFSKCASNAMTFALELAVRATAAVHVLHVIYPNEGVDNNVYDAFWIDEYYTRRLHDLSRWVNRFRKNQAFKSLTITVSCEIGFPVRSIKRVSEEQHTDLIVMGTSGATGLRAALMGSTTASVVAGLHIPVFAIPTRANFLRHTDYVLATDFDLKIDTASLKMLKNILHYQHASVHVLHVLDLSDEQPAKAAEAKAKQVLKGINHQFHYVHAVNVLQAVNNFIENKGANGLIVVSHRHSFFHKLMFQRVSRLLTQQVKVPILVLHDKQI